MSELVSWPRPRFAAGGGDALVHFEVCGEFPSELELSAPNYDSNGVPEGFDFRVEPNDFSRWQGPRLDVLRESNPEAAVAIEAAPQVVTLSGEVTYPQNLDYLRDTLGVLASLLERGGVGVVDPQTLQLFSPAGWHETFWSAGFEPTNHVVILVSISPQIEGVWLHTRGMRLFGRPDLSCHCVQPDEMQPIVSVFNGLIRMQAAGAIIPQGQAVQGHGCEEKLFCHPAGDFSDPEFDNVHLELRWENARVY